MDISKHIFGTIQFFIGNGLTEEARKLDFSDALNFGLKWRLVDVGNVAQTHALLANCLLFITPNPDRTQEQQRYICTVYLLDLDVDRLDGSGEEAIDGMTFVSTDELFAAKQVQATNKGNGDDWNITGSFLGYLINSQQRPVAVLHEAYTGA